MTTTKKLTKRDHFTAILNQYALTDEHRAFIEHELELLAKKNSSERKPTKAQMENDAIRAQILAEMEEDRLYTISEMIKELPSCADLENQRISGLFRTMYDKDFPENPECPIQRIEEKRKAYFRLNPNCGNY